MSNIDEAKVDIKKIGKIFIFLFLIFSFVVFLFPEIFETGIITDLVVAGVLVIFLITIIAFVSNRLVSSAEYKERNFKKSSRKLSPMIFYLSILLGIICIAFSVIGFLSGELTMAQRYTSRGILITRDVNTSAYWLAISAFSISGVLLIIYPIFNKIRYNRMNNDT
jgi:hypothetical protein